VDSAAATINVIPLNRIGLHTDMMTPFFLSIASNAVQSITPNLTWRSLRGALFEPIGFAQES
jgi:hypothetical protein